MESIDLVGSAVAMAARCCFTKEPTSSNPFFLSASPLPSPSALAAVPCCRTTSSDDAVRRRRDRRRLASNQLSALPPRRPGSRPTSPIPGDAEGFRYLDDYSRRETPQTLGIGDSSRLMKRIFGICKKSWSCETQSSKQNVSTLFNLRKALEFAFLTCLFTFQASQQAIAGMEIAGVQPLSYLGDLGDISTGFASAFLLIFFSELGDKTFFIAALLAARNSGVVVFLGTFGALAAMTIVSVVVGRTFHYIDDALPFRFGGTDFPIDDFAAVCLLIYFGVTTLLDAASDDRKATEEQKEAELAISEFSGNGAGIMAAASTVVSTFVLVFVAEWGDKSFFSTIALAAASSPLGVIAGALAGHAVATLLAVLGGSLLGTFMSEKVIAYVGGTLFLVFAAVTLIEIIY